MRSFFMFFSPLSPLLALSLSFFMPCLFICTSEYRIVRAMSFPSTWKWFWKCQSCLLYSVITSLLFYRIFNQWGDPWEGKYLIYALFQNLASCLRRQHCGALQRVVDLIMLPSFKAVLFSEKAIPECIATSSMQKWWTNVYKWTISIFN